MIYFAMCVFLWGLTSRFASPIPNVHNNNNHNMTNDQYKIRSCDNRIANQVPKLCDNENNNNNITNNNLCHRCKCPSCDYVQSSVLIPVKNLHNNKMTSFWAFFIGLLTAFGIMFIFWIIVDKGKFMDNLNSTCGCTDNNTSILSTCYDRYFHANKYPKCTAQRHRQPYCILPLRTHRLK